MKMLIIGVLTAPFLFTTNYNIPSLEIGLGSAISKIGCSSSDDIISGASRSSSDDIFGGASRSSSDDIIGGASRGSSDDIVSGIGRNSSDDIARLNKLQEIEENDIKKQFNTKYEIAKIERYSEDISIDNLLLEVKEPVLINLLPRTSADYTKVFKRDVTFDMENQILNFDKKIKALKKTNKVESFKSLNEINSLLDDINSNPIIIYGHSINDGRTLILADGTRIEVKALHIECRDRNRNCMVLTCKGNDFGLNDNVEVNEGLSMFEHAVNESNTKVFEFRDDMINYRRNLKMRKNLTVSFISIGATTGTGYLVHSNAKENKKKNK